MTRAELEARAARKVAALSPDLATAIMLAIAAIRDAGSLAAIERLIEAGDTAGLITLLTENAEAKAAIRAYADQMRKAFNAGAVFAEPAVRRVRVPRPFRTTIPPANILAEFHYDYLNPRVIEAIREYQGVGISTFTDDIADGIRVVVEEGLKAGVNPRTTAIQLRELVGLSESRVSAVLSYRRLLESRDVKVLARAWRDKRGDPANLAKLIEAVREKKEGARAVLDAAYNKWRDGMTPDRIDRYVAAYERKARAAEALTIARTNAHDALKASQRAVWDQAVDEGRIDAGLLEYTWHTAGDNRVRDEHADMNRKKRRHGGTYPNGQAYPGEGDYNCRCFETMRVG